MSSAVKTSAGVALCALLLCAEASFVCGAGKTYPDGSVSPFAPAFFGVGICQGSISSEVNGVAANGGTFIGAVGDCQNSEDTFSNYAAAVLFQPNGSSVLPQENSSRASSALGISADGKIKVGFVGGDACYWDASNQFHLLPSRHPGDSAAFGVSSDGSTIGGYLPALEGSTPNAMFDAVLWATGGTGYSVPERPSTYDTAEITSLSGDGQMACGFTIRYGENDNVRVVVGAEGAFRLKSGGNMELLPSLGNTDTTIATGISKDGIYVVGQSADQAVLWSDDNRISPLQNPTGGTSIATAVSDQFGRIVVGWSRNNDTLETTALLWNNEQPRTIRGLLNNTYKVNTGLWQIATAACISSDGYTVGGQGTNPEGKFEGWIAVLPPILHPPILSNPGRPHANPGELFALSIGIKNYDDLTDYTYSAKGLPAGFMINGSGSIVGTWAKDQVPAGDYTVTVTATNKEGSGSTSFVLSLPPQNVVDKLLEGHSYLPQNKAPGDVTYYASVGNGTSADGQTAGGTDGYGSDARGYVWTSSDGISGLPMLDGALRTYSSAAAVSADGKTVVGQAESAPGDDGKDHSVAVVWKTSAAAALKAERQPTHYAEAKAASSLTATNIGVFPKGGVSQATAVSADGSVVVGYGDEKIDGVSYEVYQAFKWTATDGMVGLGWLPGGRRLSEAYGISADGSTIVGTSDSSIGSQPMRYTAAEGMVGLGLPAGASYGTAVAASVDGSVIVGYNNFNGNDHAFRWTAAEGMTDLGVLPGDVFSRATAVSADGSIVVGYSAPDFNKNRAFIWDKANGMRDLQSVVVAANPDLSSWILTTANGVSSDGKTIVGAGKNPNGDLEGFTAVLQVQSARPLNISTRMRVLSGENSLIGGFIITGTETKKVLLRGIGPSLIDFGVQGAMPDPTLELHQGSAVVASNDNWKDSQQSDITATGIAPTNDLESAIVVNLAPGAYTAILVDKNNQPGVGLVEVYDLGGNSTLANISTRGFVDTGDNVMIGGFIVGAGGVGGYDRVLVRAVGPSLTGSGVSGALGDTTLELHDNNGLTVAANDNWKDSQEADIRATGIQPASDLESAILETLAPGAYTAIVRGKDGATGVGLIEVYSLQ